MIAHTEADVIRLSEGLDQLDDGDHLGIDTETTGLGIFAHDRLLGISIAFRGEGWYVPVGHAEGGNVPPEAVAKLGAALEATRATQVFHNGAGVDFGALEQVGIGPPERYFDTQVFHWLDDENPSHQLKTIGAQVFGIDAKAEHEHLKQLRKGRKRSDIYRELRAQDEWQSRPAKEARAEAAVLAEASKKDWPTFTADDIGAYAEKDAVLTHDLYDWFHTLAQREDDPWPAVGRELRLQYVIHRMKRLGVAVDLERVERVRSKDVARMHEIEPVFEGVNLNSTPQLQKLLYEEWGLPVTHLTKTGNPSTNHETLEELATTFGDEHPIGQLMEYRKLSKAVGTYYDAMLRFTDDDGRVHTDFNSARTVTGRFSSSNPNLQNIPRESTNPEVKAMFQPAHGYELWEYDLSSAELRVAASLADETNMIEAIAEEGRDLHTETAESIFGTADQHHRTLAKNLNYGIPYGIGPSKFATYMVAGSGHPVTPAEISAAKKIITKHKVTFPRLHRLIRVLEQFARANGYVPLHKEGRYRRFRSGGLFVPYYHAINSVVQGGVAELMKDVMIEVEPELEYVGARMVLQVHDSLWIEVPPGAHEEVHRLLTVVTKAVSPFRMEMPWDMKQLGEHDA